MGLDEPDAAKTESQPAGQTQTNRARFPNNVLAVRLIKNPYCHRSARSAKAKAPATNTRPGLTMAIKSSMAKDHR